MLHLFRRIAQHSWGARSRIYQTLVPSVSQPSLVYHAQFQRFTEAEWARRLETLNRATTRVITGLPCLTPIPTLQAKVQLNTLDELIEQRRQAWALKVGVVPPAVALACYMTPSASLVDPPEALLHPWCHCQVTDNKLLGCFRQTHRSAPATRLTVLPPPASTPADAHLVAYVDAWIDCVIAPCSPCSLLLSSRQRNVFVPPDQTSTFRAGRVGGPPRCLTAVLPIITARRPLRVLFYTDSLQAVRALRRVDGSLCVATAFHRFVAECPCPVHVCWIPRSSVPAHTAADAACHPRAVVQALPLSKLPATDPLSNHKETAAHHMST